MSLTYTENQSLTFDSSNDARLDFFFHVIEGSSPERTTELLEKSWSQSPLDTMKLIINCRDIRNGKGIRPQALICLQWLYKNQFDNLMLNLTFFDEFGCWKDYLNLLLIALFDVLPNDVNTKDKRKYKSHYTHVNPFDTVILRSFPKTKRRELEMIPTVFRKVERKFIVADEPKNIIRHIITERNLDGKKFEYKSMDKYFPKIDDDNIGSYFYKIKTNKAKLKKLNEYRLEYFNKIYENDSKFRQLYDRIVDLFAQQLAKDYDHLKMEKFSEISLAPKWLPNRGRYFDKYFFILGPIAKKFFELKPKLSAEIDHSTKPNEEKRMIHLLSRICTEMRRKLQVPEILMSSKSWETIDYKRVPSIAMLRYRDAFIRSDQERLNEFIGTKSLNAGALTPADLVKQVMNGTILGVDIFNEPIPENIDEQKSIALKAIDNQWKSLVENIRSNETLLFTNTLAVCDVSGSMCYTSELLQPIHGAIGLTLFLMEIADKAWDNRCISFSETPSFHQIDMTRPLVERCRQMVSCSWGMNTDLNKVFDLILTYGKEKNLTNKQMPSILFIFTDMEFDCAIREKTNFQSCKIQYELAGYQMPFIIFWNLKGGKKSRSTPVKYNQDGVILLSGFSAQTFKFLFTIKDLNELSPLTMLLKIINDPRYDCIKVN
ncbi:hypothetical protein BLA29_001631 [Euroglyphus maynei]|uniref:DUF2828 domain containing protein n=1 Tax=Euroglyphus maynei TaxID=6958 RepID=A0A1Y3BCU5_EURMA|nr:hypothetical protein BLA29_001631 [Euroglyphus maynei]